MFAGDPAAFVYPFRLEPEDEFQAGLVRGIADDAEAVRKMVSLGEPVSRSVGPAALEPAGVHPVSLQPHGGNSGNRLDLVALGGLVSIAEEEERVLRQQRRDYPAIEARDVVCQQECAAEGCAPACGPSPASGRAGCAGCGSIRRAGASSACVAGRPGGPPRGPRCRWTLSSHWPVQPMAPTIPPRGHWRLKYGRKRLRPLFLRRAA